MPKDATPVTTPAAAPAAAPVTTPNPAPASAAPVASPASPSQRDPKGRFTKPVAAPDARKVHLSAAKALGLDEDPSKTAQGAVADARKKFHVSAPQAEEPEPVEELAEVEALTPAAHTVKIGEKEFTAEQIAAQLQELEELKMRSAAPASSEQQEPEVIAPPAAALTPEQIARRESDFLKTTSEALDAPLTEQEIDTLLAGGAEAVKLFQHIRKGDMARAILEARKGVAAGLNPIMQQLFSELGPLVGHHQQLRQQLVEQHFVSKHADFVPFVDKARAVATELAKRYPAQVAKMSADQFVDEVARQTGNILDREWKSFHPNDSTSWRDAAKAAVVPARAITPSLNPLKKPAAVKPPVGNPPSGPSSATAPDWQKGVAASLR